MSDVSRSVAWVSAGCIGAVSWLTFFAAPLEYYEALPTSDDRLWKLVVETAKFRSAVFDGAPLVGPLFVLLSAALFFFAIQFSWRVLNHFTRGRAWTTALSTRLVVYFHDSRLRRASVSREQFLIANKPNVTSYQTYHKADHGRIVHEGRIVESIIAGELLTASTEVIDQGSAITIYEDYKRALPTSWLATYSPAWLVLFLLGQHVLFTNKVVRRIIHLDFVDEYNGPSARFSVGRTKGVGRIVVELDFPSDAAPRREDLRCVLDDGQYHRRLAPELEIISGRWVYRVTLSGLSGLSGESVVIHWRNHRLARLETMDSNA